MSETKTEGEQDRHLEKGDRGERINMFSFANKENVNVIFSGGAVLWVFREKCLIYNSH